MNEILAQETYRPKLSILDFGVKAHYRLPLSPRLRADVFAGPTYYQSTLRFERLAHYAFFNEQQDYSFQAKKGTFGFESGLALDYRICSMASFFAEVDYRCAKLTDLRGDWTEDESSIFGSSHQSGNDHYFWFFNADAYGQTYPLITFDRDVPFDTNISGARKGELNLSGFSAAAGVKFNF